MAVLENLCRVITPFLCKTAAFIRRGVSMFDYLPEISLYLLRCFLFGAGGYSPTGCLQCPCHDLHEPKLKTCILLFSSEQDENKTDLSQLPYPPQTNQSRWLEHAIILAKLRGVFLFCFVLTLEFLSDIEMAWSVIWCKFSICWVSDRTFFRKYQDNHVI